MNYSQQCASCGKHDYPANKYSKADYRQFIKNNDSLLGKSYQHWAKDQREKFRDFAKVRPMVAMRTINCMACIQKLRDGAKKTSKTSKTKKTAESVVDATALVEPVKANLPAIAPPEFKLVEKPEEIKKEEPEVKLEIKIPEEEAKKEEVPEVPVMRVEKPPEVDINAMMPENLQDLANEAMQVDLESKNIINPLLP